MFPAASAIEMDRVLVAERGTITSLATRMCACRDLACGEKQIDEFLHWSAELVAAGNDRPGLANYANTIESDATVQQQSQILNDCWVVLAARPWAATCQKQLERAVAAFARKAPKAYPPYKSLRFAVSGVHADDPAGTIAAARVSPGHTWKFEARVGSRSLMQPPHVPASATADATWLPHPGEQGPVLTRSIQAPGKPVVVLQVRSEQWGDSSFDDHPLAKLFFAELKQATAACKP
jgi:hypothetical protein